MNMVQELHKTKRAAEKEIQAVGNEHHEFSDQVIYLGAIACNNVKGNDFDKDKARKKCRVGVQALKAMGGLQEMLATQMLSIHNLQQLSMAMVLANDSAPIDVKYYFMNTAVKLANVFSQQANLLNKLQGNGEHKIIVERVDVHNGGQAVVGNIQNRDI